METRSKKGRVTSTATHREREAAMVRLEEEEVFKVNDQTISHLDPTHRNFDL
jgi:hypothetical protein